MNSGKRCKQLRRAIELLSSCAGKKNRRTKAQLDLSLVGAAKDNLKKNALWIERQQKED